MDYRGVEGLLEVIAKLNAQIGAQQQRIAELGAENLNLKARLADLHRPTHGPCCTCQQCGKHYDDCRCSLDEAIVRAEQAERERDEDRARLENAKRILCNLIRVNGGSPLDEEAALAAIDRARKGENQPANG